MKPYFSLVMWAKEINIAYYRDALESIVQQTFQDFELYVMDDDSTGIAAMLAREFFPEDDRIHIRELKKHKGGAYALNVGVHFSEGYYVVLVGCHDRLSPDTLQNLYDETLRHDTPGIIYTDHDELVGMDRMNPHFKEHFNKALLLRSAYMGDFLCFSSEVCDRIGSFNEKLSAAYIYEYLLRCMHVKVRFYHIPSLIYHKRVLSGIPTRELRRLNTRNYKEHVKVAEAFFKKIGVDAIVEAEPSERRWKVTYDGSDYEINSRDYIFMKDEEVKLVNRHAIERMYGFLKQKDIAVVGLRFLGQAFTVDNIGFFADSLGEVYPAFHGQRIYRESYEGLANVPRDCAMVDPGCCMIDAKAYRKLGGFNPALSGRDAMLDFCLRAREKGLRTIVIPYISARYKVKNVVSNAASRSKLLELWGDVLKQGDAFYNANLNVGLTNYKLPGDIDEEKLADVAQLTQNISSVSESQTQQIPANIENINMQSNNPLTYENTEGVNTDLKM